MTDEPSLVTELRNVDNGDAVAFDLENDRTLAGTISERDADEQRVVVSFAADPELARSLDLPDVDSTVVVSTESVEGSWEPIRAHAEYPPDEMTPMVEETEERTLGIVESIDVEER